MLIGGGGGAMYEATKNGAALTFGGPTSIPTYPSLF